MRRTQYSTRVGSFFVFRVIIHYVVIYSTDGLNNGLQLASYSKILWSNITILHHYYLFVSVRHGLRQPLDGRLAACKLQLATCGTVTAGLARKMNK